MGNLRVFLFYFYRDVLIEELLIILRFFLDFDDFSFLPLCRLLCAMSSITPFETIRMSRADSSVNCSSGHQSGGELGTLSPKGGFDTGSKVKCSVIEFSLIRSGLSLVFSLLVHLNFSLIHQDICLFIYLCVYAGYVVHRFFCLLPLESQGLSSGC